MRDFITFQGRVFRLCFKLLHASWRLLVYLTKLALFYSVIFLCIYCCGIRISVIYGFRASILLTIGEVKHNVRQQQQRMIRGFHNFSQSMFEFPSLVYLFKKLKRQTDVIFLMSFVIKYKNCSCPEQVFPLLLCFGQLYENKCIESFYVSKEYVCERFLYFYFKY